MASTIFERMRGDAASGWALETAGLGETTAAASTLTSVIKFVDTWDPLFGPASQHRWAKDLHEHLSLLCRQLESDFSDFLGWFLVEFPEKSVHVDRVRTERAVIVAKLRRIVDALERLGGPIEPEELNVLSALLDQLHQNREQETELVYKAYWRDSSPD